MKSKEYAVYKGEEILVIGTLEECAAYLKVKPDTVLFYKSPAHKARTSKNGRRTVELGVSG